MLKRDIHSNRKKRTSRPGMSGCVTTRGITRMKRVARLDIPAGKRVDPAHGGDHVMFIGLTEPLEAGDVEVVVHVATRGDDAAWHSH